MERADLILALAQLVVKSNLENYREYCEGDGQTPTSKDFCTFGTDRETVSQNTQDLIDEVVDKAYELQLQLGPILFDK